MIAKAFSLLDAKARIQGALLGVLVLIGTALEAGGVGLIFPLIRVIGDPSLIGQTAILATTRDFLGIDDRTLIYLAIGGVAGLVLAKNILAAFNVFAQFRFVFENEARVSHRLFECYLTQPWAEAVQRNSSEMATNCSKAVFTTFTSVILATILLLTEAAMALAVIAVLIAVAPMVTTIAAGVLGGGIALFFLGFRKRLAAFGARDLALRQTDLKHLQESFQSAKEIRALGRTRHFLDIYAGLRRDANRNYMFHQAFTQLPRLFLEGVAVLGLLVVLTIILAQGTAAADLMATLALFAVAAFRLMPATSKIIHYLSQIRAAGAHVEKVTADLGLGCSVDETPMAEAPTFRNAIVIDRVSYRYPGGAADVLTDISLEIPCGQSVAFVGSSGAGKSTLADLILGLLQPTGGRLMIDGHDAAQSRKSWRRLIGYVPQQVHLLDDTLRRNVAFGMADGDIDDDRVRAAISRARLGEVVATLPQGLDTIIGENGLRLSGGQRQRVSIARALYNQPQVLVLDEATSALDNETEREITDAIEALGGQMTTIVIAHRLSTVRNCDRIIMLKNGKVADSGGFDELVARNADMRRSVELGQLLPASAETDA